LSMPAVVKARTACRSVVFWMRCVRVDAGCVSPPPRASALTTHACCPALAPSLRVCRSKYIKPMLYRKKTTALHDDGPVAVDTETIVPGKSAHGAAHGGAAHHDEPAHV
jgi:hypothetical protein